MSLWNPTTFSITGAAIYGRPPAALRVLGGEATPGQLAAAQQTFARFCDRMRSSVVPNPMEQGLLSDGTAYRIVVVGMQATMTIQPVGPGGDFGDAGIGVTMLVGAELTYHILTPAGVFMRDTGRWKSREVDDILGGPSAWHAPGSDYYVWGDDTDQKLRNRNRDRYSNMANDALAVWVRSGSVQLRVTEQYTADPAYSLGITLMPPLSEGSAPSIPGVQSVLSGDLLERPENTVPSISPSRPEFLYRREQHPALPQYEQILGGVWLRLVDPAGPAPWAFQSFSRAPYAAALGRKGYYRVLVTPDGVGSAFAMVQTTDTPAGSYSRMPADGEKLVRRVVQKAITASETPDAGSTAGSVSQKDTAGETYDLATGYQYQRDGSVVVLRDIVDWEATVERTADGSTSYSRVTGTEDFVGEGSYVSELLHHRRHRATKRFGTLELVTVDAQTEAIYSAARQYAFQFSANYVDNIQAGVIADIKTTVRHLVFVDPGLRFIAYQEDKYESSYTRNVNYVGSGTYFDYSTGGGSRVYSPETYDEIMPTRTSRLVVKSGGTEFTHDLKRQVNLAIYKALDSEAFPMQSRSTVNLIVDNWDDIGFLEPNGTTTTERNDDPEETRLMHRAVTLGFENEVAHGISVEHAYDPRTRALAIKLIFETEAGSESAAYVVDSLGVRRLSAILPGATGDAVTKLESV